MRIRIQLSAKAIQEVAMLARRLAERAAREAHDQPV